MKTRAIACALTSIAFATFLAIGAPAGAGATALANQSNAPVRAVAVIQAAVRPYGKLGSPANPARPNSSPDTWPVVGNPCRGNPYGWCDMFAHAIVGNPPLDEYSVGFEFDPHWLSVDVKWKVVTTNSHPYLKNFRVRVHVMCLSNRDCKDFDHALGGEGGSKFKVQYPVNLKGRLVLFGLEFFADCPRCAAGFQHLYAHARTREARCLKTRDICKFV